jgi:predicted ribosome quality control (RQC) complex YloA/Tae2 family protein
MPRSDEAEPRRFPLAEGWEALVGRGDRENDHLTFRIAFPQDWWLHAKGCPGSHVVLHHPDGGEPPKDVLEAAAQLAVRYSKAKNAGKTAVTLAKVSDMQKPKGAPAGQVLVRKAKTLVVRLESRTTDQA